MPSVAKCSRLASCAATLRGWRRRDLHLRLQSSLGFATRTASLLRPHLATHRLALTAHALGASTACSARLRYSAPDHLVCAVSCSGPSAVQRQRGSARCEQSRRPTTCVASRMLPAWAHCVNAPVGETVFQAPSEGEAPAVVGLPRLLSITQRISRDADTDGDWRLIMAPCTSLGGARSQTPRMVDRQGRLHVERTDRQGER